MKYDRPVWQLMHACADAMPDVFRYDDVRAWFATNFPEVGESFEYPPLSTVRSRGIGGDAAPVAFEREDERHRPHS